QADQLNGDDLTNYLYGHDGNDQIYGLGGHDVINGGAGSDYLVGGAGDDSIAGQSNQSKDKPDDSNTIFGNGGDDQIGGGSYTDVIDGGADSDFISGYTGDDKISGGAGIDFIAGDSFSVLRAYYPERNNQVVASFYGLNKKDDKYTYNDVISGGDGDDTIYGEMGDDIISGDAGADVIFGDRSISADLNASASALITENFYWKEGKQPGALPVELHGDDILSGGDGEDVIVGNGGNDRLYGGNGTDRLYGDSRTENSELSGNDYLDGGAGSDILRGGDGDDILRGGYGKDLLEGEKGNDLYLFQRNDGIDFIEDTEGQNTIRLTNIAFDDINFGIHQNEQGGFLVVDHKELNIFNEKDALLINAFEKGTSTVKSGVEDMQIEFVDGTRKTVLELRNQVVQSESEVPTRSARRVRSVDNDVQLSSASKVDVLVQAMATLATSDASDMSSPPTVNTLLRPVLTTSAV
ncbi:calcium-binding protein, partial [Zooshikella harenae]